MRRSILTLLLLSGPIAAQGDIVWCGYFGELHPVESGIYWTTPNLTEDLAKTLADSNDWISAQSQLVGYLLNPDWCESCMYEDRCRPVIYWDDMLGFDGVAIKDIDTGIWWAGINVIGDAPKTQLWCTLCE